MSSFSQKPVYIPRNKRKRVPDHTVYSVGKEDGWKPSDDSVRAPLSAQEIMDDRDFETWGGATGLRKEFAATAASSTTNDAISDLFVVKGPTKVGDKLLAKLGWKPATGSTIVPATADESSHEHGMTLSRTKLRRIQLQQKRVEIPTPKLDYAGLGYDPHQNAPEFQAYKERMLKRQQSRKSKNVYHVDDVLRRDRQQQNVDRRRDETDRDDDFAKSYPHMALQDFVGTQSATGFALHDDDDDNVFDYDDATSKHVSAKIKLNAEDYDMVAYEPVDDSSEDEAYTKNSKPAALSSLFGDALSSWAGAATDEKTPAESATAVTADGKKPLPGFVLGSSDHSFQSRRFRGPDFPIGYEIKPHVFGPNESPMVLQALSHYNKLAAAERRDDHIMDQARINAPVKRSVTAPTNPAINVFGGISKAMNDRFMTASSVEPTSVEEINNSAVEEINNNQQPSAIQNKRTFQPFYPEPLLCKRFGVPALSQATMPTDASASRTREEVFFHDQVLAHVKRTEPSVAVKKPSTTRAIERVQEYFENDPLLSVERPEKEVFKSIFAVDSDTSSSDAENEPNSTAAIETRADDRTLGAFIQSSYQQIVDASRLDPVDSKHHPTEPSSELVRYEPATSNRKTCRTNSDNSSTDLSTSTIDSDHRRSSKRRKKHSKHKKKHKKKWKSDR